MKNSLSYFSRLMAVLLLLLSMQSVQAKNDNNLHLIELAGKQEKISQQIAKNYFYMKSHLLVSQAETELKQALANYKLNRVKLIKGLGKSDIAEMFDLIDILADDFLSYVSTKDYSVSSAAQVLEMSEAITEAYADMSLALLEKNKSKKSEYLHVIERQEMQIEKLAKYYVAYTSEFNDHNTAIAINDVVKDFEKDLNYMKKTNSGNATITKEVKNIGSMWKIMKKYYTNVEEQQLPVIVLVTTNKILASIEEIAHIVAGSKKA